VISNGKNQYGKACNALMLYDLREFRYRHKERIICDKYSHPTAELTTGVDLVAVAGRRVKNFTVFLQTVQFLSRSSIHFHLRSDFVLIEDTLARKTDMN
jgi:hypothetical protein